MEQLFIGKSAVVTGAGHGIGRAIALALVAQGADVVAVDKDGDNLSKLSVESDRIKPLVAELGIDDPIELAERVLKAAPEVSLIINNVGVNSAAAWDEVDSDQLQYAIRANLLDPWELTKQLTDAMRRDQRSGSVLFISSLHERFVRHHPEYSTTKAAVSMLAREMAVSLAPSIRVNTILPGAINTNESKVRAQNQRAKRLIPLGRVGNANDVAKQALILLSDEWSGYITGASLAVDGGLSLHTWLDDLYSSPADERQQNS